MKYGESLGTYSVPEWRSHNILYDELKHEIKDLTVAPAAFSKSSYSVLVESFREEFSSVNLFVHCKISEIEYRFQQCDQLVRELAKAPETADGNDEHADADDEDENDGDEDEPDFRTGINGDSNRNGYGGSSTHVALTIANAPDRARVRELKKDVTKLTQEIQNLSRFIGAQFTGFRKLIKKYRRHAPAEQIDKGRDLEEIEDLLVSKGSFAEIDLTPQFLELSLLYAAIRTNGYQDFINQPAKSTSMVDQMASYDVEMLSVPVSDVYRFWVHPDNVMQLKVLLIQHMDLLAPPELQESLTHQHQHLPPSQVAMQQQQQQQQHPHHEGQTIAMYMDTEDLQSARNLKEPAQIRHITFGKEHSKPFLLVPMGGMRHPAVMKLSDRQVTALQNGKYDETTEDINNSESHGSSSSAAGEHNNKANGSGVGNSGPAKTRRPSSSVGAQLALGWVSSHRSKPVVTLSMKRTRFKSDEDHVWAAIDTNVMIEMPTEQGVKIPFPYSVFEIRIRNSNPLPWIDSLRQSHLVYPVSSTFSLYGWALLTTRPQQVLVRPNWLDVLEAGTEIRREPSKVAMQPLRMVKAQKSLSNLKLVGGRSPDHKQRYSEDVVNGTDNADTNGASGNEERRATRYWNEFDDGEEFQESSEHFFDEIDEELRRARVASRLTLPVYRIGEGVRRHFSTFFDNQSSTSDLEYADERSVRSLDSQYSSSLEHTSRSVGGQFSPRVGPSRRGSADGSPRYQRSNPGVANYGACGSLTSEDVRSEIMRRRHDRGLALITFLCFFLSVFIVGLVFVILFTENVLELPAGLRAALILFLSAALCLALMGYIAYNFRSEAGWASQMAVHVALLTVVCFGVGGVANIAVPPVSA